MFVVEFRGLFEASVDIGVKLYIHIGHFIFFFDKHVYQC